MANTNSLSSGDGTRPTTDGGVDNIGGAKSFTPGQGSADAAPAPKEKMSESKKDRAAMRRDDSAPMGLTESAENTPNTEPPASNPVRA